MDTWGDGVIEVDINTLHLLLRHDPETGRLFWRKRDVSLFADGKHSAAHTAAKWNARCAGMEAGSVGNHGYRRVSIEGRYFLTSRIIFAMTNGHWPAEELNHIGGKKTDNRLSKIREASRIEIARNQKRHKTSTSGVTGVCWNKRKGRWQAYIWVENVRRHLGDFGDFDVAVAARRAAEIEFDFHPNHGQRA
jgi:hypothetical protein